ncbi:MAG: hypothetical protein KME64_17040 [Scytonematopsis contorta HA4267-MV1]|jgi:hypothetical protein|nr:hypothetical protein [Scytonematopsis contorta HA4267-MV1]
MSTNNQETQLNLAVASEVVELNDNDLEEVAGGCGYHHPRPQPKKRTCVVYRPYYYSCH